MTKLPKGEPKLPKLPKSLGACVDLYHEVREKRLAANKVTEEIKVTETFIANHIIDNVPKGDTGVVGSKYKGVVKTSDVYQVDDWEAFYKWIQKNGNFEVLNRALNQAAVEEHVEALNTAIDKFNGKLAKDDPKRKPRKMLPGVKTFKAVKLSVTKA